MTAEQFQEEVLNNGHLVLSGEAKLSKGAGEFLDRVIDILTESEVSIEDDRCLFRAQEGGDLVRDCYLDEQEISGIRAYQEERMVPDLSFCGEGRFHRKGEAGFYFADEPLSLCTLNLRIGH